MTLVNAAGNQHEDTGAPLPDRISPDFPLGTAHTRTIDNRSCLDLPSEGPHVMSICRTQEPLLRTTTAGHKVACHLTMSF